MAILLLLLLLVVPLTALADPTERHMAAHPGYNVIPDGRGNVIAWPGQGGTDAYTAGLIAQGLTQMSRPAPGPHYVAPPFEFPDTSAVRHDNYIQDSMDRSMRYIESHDRR